MTARSSRLVKGDCKLDCRSAVRMLVQGLGVAQWNLLKSGENCAELKYFLKKKLIFLVGLVLKRGAQKLNVDGC